MRAGVLCARTSVADAVRGKHPQRVQPTILTERLFSKKGAEAFREHHVRACPMLQICGRVRDVQMRARTRRSGRLRASESCILLHMVIRKQMKARQVAGAKERRVEWCTVFWAFNCKCLQVP